VEPEIVPEPAPQERKALLEAMAELDRAAEGGPARDGQWWRSGFAAEDDAFD
jgi:hypothetical protein